MNVPEQEIKALLTKYKKFVVYGLSPDPTKASNSVPLYMRDQGCDIVGTYPKIHQNGGFKIYQNLSEVPAEYRKFVDVFRSSDKIPEIVDEVLKMGGVEVLWLQLGISNSVAEILAENAGLKVISDRCLAIEHRKYF